MIYPREKIIEYTVQAQNSSISLESQGLDTKAQRAFNWTTLDTVAGETGGLGGKPGLTADSVGGTVDKLVYANNGDNTLGLEN